MRAHDPTRAHRFESSYGNASGGDPVVGSHDLADAARRKSSNGDGDGGNRVEALDDVPGAVPVRDGKNPGPALAVRADAWAAFAGHLAG
ncbi:DUF397 domain-containing protein [Streptomyces sp. NPDC012438]|uniref:DUF397 domain-containing protein n=1 Tax=Streptomyces sp. NPDC012438 TaxID=3364833 RepID=UPI0036E3B5B6